MTIINVLKDGTIVDDMSKVDPIAHPLPPDAIRLIADIILGKYNEPKPQ